MLAVIVIVVVVALTASSSSSTDAAPLELSSSKERAVAALRRVPLIDGHNDLPWQLRERYKNQLKKVVLPMCALCSLNFNEKYSTSV